MYVTNLESLIGKPCRWLKLSPSATHLNLYSISHRANMFKVVSCQRYSPGASTFLLLDFQPMYSGVFVKVLLANGLIGWTPTHHTEIEPL